MNLSTFIVEINTAIIFIRLEKLFPKCTES